MFQDRLQQGARLPRFRQVALKQILKFLKIERVGPTESLCWITGAEGRKQVIRFSVEVEYSISCRWPSDSHVHFWEPQATE